MLLPISIPVLCLSLAPSQAAGSVFDHVSVPLGALPLRVSVASLDPGQAEDVTLLVEVPGAHELRTFGWFQGSVRSQVKTDLKDFNFFPEVPNFELADLNGDGFLDIGFSSILDPSQFFLGNGDLSFGGGSFLPSAGGNQSDVGFVDIDGDGFLDSVLLVEDGGWFLDCGLNNGAGTQFNMGSCFAFAPGTHLSGGCLLFADVEGNGQTSTFVTGGTGLARTNWPGGPPTDELILGGLFSDVLKADLDGVNGLDLVVCEPSQHRIQVLLNDGTGAFPAPQIYAVGREPANLTVGDLNSDGILDLAIADRVGNRAYVLCGNGGGRFLPCGDVPVGQSPVDIAAGDVDGDGDLDLVAACAGDETLSFLLNSL